MANGQTGIGFKPPRASNASAPVPVQQFSPLAGGLLAGQQVQRAGQIGMAGPPQVPNPNAVPPPGGMPVQRITAPSDRIPPGLMRFLNRGGMLPNPNAVAPPGMVPGQPQPQFNQFAPGVPGGLPDPNAVAPIGLQQFPVGGMPPGQAPMVPQGDMPIRGIVPGMPGVLPGSGTPGPGQIPRGAGPIPRNLLNLAMRRTGFMPQLGFFGP